MTTTNEGRALPDAPGFWINEEGNLIDAFWQYQSDIGPPELVCITSGNLRFVSTLPVGGWQTVQNPSLYSDVEWEKAKERLARTIARTWQGRAEKAEAEAAALRGALEAAECLLRTAIGSIAHDRKSKRFQNWSNAGWLFGLGSGEASKLCVKLGIDPDGYEVPPAAELAKGEA
jgi:hypothetical protein